VLPPVRYDTAYIERRRVGWDAYIDVRGNRYRVTPKQEATEEKRAPAQEDWAAYRS
jgi:hypothetical protein